MPQTHHVDFIYVRSHLRSQRNANVAGAIGFVSFIINSERFLVCLTPSARLRNFDAVVNASRPAPANIIFQFKRIKNQAGKCAQSHTNKRTVDAFHE